MKLLIGVVSTLAALVLGLLIASAKGSYDTKISGIAEICADLIQHDRAMAQYGAETAEARKRFAQSRKAGSSRSGPLKVCSIRNWARMRRQTHWRSSSAGFV
ncbi:MAG: hypothetical protein ACREVG_06880, partial [Burkholderiales bacterium]